jgi:AraC-like DNA-binding protein
MTGPASDHAIAWRPAVPGIAEVLHATFRAHRYPPHVHDTWTVLLLETGVVRYDLDGRAHTADTGSLTILPPGVPHDGHAATAAGFRKRVLYVETTAVPDHLAGAAVDAPLITSPVATRAARELHALLADPEDGPTAELAFGTLTDHLLDHLGDRATRDPVVPSIARRLRDHLDDHLTDGTSLTEAAAAVGTSVGHAARSFTAAYGVAPHAYVVGRRIDLARRRLLGGSPVATVAAETGFTDQAHLTRHFRRYLGNTPAAFRRDRR